jgi:hypothetical protein
MPSSDFAVSLTKGKHHALDHFSHITRYCFVHDESGNRFVA